jgi:hypothetical protein
VPRSTARGSVRRERAECAGAAARGAATPSRRTSREVGRVPARRSVMTRSSGDSRRAMMRDTHSSSSSTSTRASDRNCRAVLPTTTMSSPSRRRRHSAVRRHPAACLGI